MKPDKYTLDERGNPVAEPDLFKWGLWFQTSERHVGDERIGPYRISTVFLGLDHNFGNDGPPVLWETMVFGSTSSHDLDCDRCSGSREQAEAMHARMVEKYHAKVK